MGKKIAQQINEAPTMPAPPDLAQLGVALAGEKAPPRRSPAEMRAKLIAAHVALSDVWPDIEGSWQSVRDALHAIEAQIGRMELRGAYIRRLELRGV